MYLFDKNNDDIYSKIAQKFNIDKRVVQVICNHPFIFIKKVMSDETDEKSIMLHYFGKFRFKRRYKGMKKEILMNKEEVVNKITNNKKNGK